VSIYANASHAFMYVGGLRFDTVEAAAYDSGPNSGKSGARWRVYPSVPGWADWVVRHPVGVVMISVNSGFAIMIVMRARDVIVVARRRAGFTQQELGRKMGVPQATVARWESGFSEPKFRDVQKATVACGLDLTLGFANADEGSWNSLIYEQLQRTPAERVLKLSRGRPERVEALKLVGEAGLRAIVVGTVAGALHGWPLILDGPSGVDLLVHPADRQRAAEVIAAAPGPERIRLLDVLPGAWGYGDLARNSECVEVEGVAVQVGALVDLLRIAQSERGGAGAEFALALDATLQLTERLRSSALEAPKLTDREAREEADRWLARQTAA
jgi:transcriptional regulator with XRE-family HTH domain